MLDPAVYPGVLGVAAAVAVVTGLVLAVRRPWKVPPDEPLGNGVQIAAVVFGLAVLVALLFAALVLFPPHGT